MKLRILGGSNSELEGIVVSSYNQTKVGLVRGVLGMEIRKQNGGLFPQTKKYPRTVQKSTFSSEIVFFASNASSCVS